jgi:Zn ribbon nucleic-acid-binding protein
MTLEQTRTVGCPECGNLDEIPRDEAIQCTGVRCSNCGHDWFYESPEQRKQEREAPQRREFCRAWVLRNGWRLPDEASAWEEALAVWEARPDDL